MSGGSFNYLYIQDRYETWELERMADALFERGMDEAAAATRALIPARASRELAALWKAVEWRVSCDWSEAEVARAFVEWERAESARQPANLHTTPEASPKS